MELSEFENAYNAQLDLRADLGVTVERILNELLDAEGISNLSILHRVKSRESALRKLASKSLTSFEQMTDIVGLRIITYLRDDVDTVARIVEREFEIDVANSVDKRATLDPDRFGYLSLHYVGSLSSSRIALTEYRRFKGIRFELQIRSVLQHAWAEIEHDIGYKSESAVPRSERRAFSRLAGLLEMADDEFVRIRDRLAAHQTLIAEEVARGDRDVEIDQDSILALLGSGDETLDRMDQAIARLGAGENATNGMPDRDYAGARATQLRRCGINSLGDIWRVLADKEDEVLDFARRWFHNDYPAGASLLDLPEHEDQIQPDTVYKQTPERLAELSWPRGISLYWLSLYLGARGTLDAHQTSGKWDKGTSLKDRAYSACLAATLGLAPVAIS